jgi:hypothetical protein
MPSCNLFRAYILRSASPNQREFLSDRHSFLEKGSLAITAMPINVEIGKLSFITFFKNNACIIHFLCVYTVKASIKKLIVYAGVAIVMKRLFVGNLPYNTTDEDLISFFSAVGEVGSARVICDRETGRSRGFGFVEVEDGALREATALNDTDFGGRKIRVSEAHEREQRERAYPSR